MRIVGGSLVVLLMGCAGQTPAESVAPAGGAAAPRDAAHPGVQGPHGDHTPQHGGLVLMNGDIHYEVVFARDGRHRVWFTDAVRQDLPASVAAGLTMEITRPDASREALRLEIDDAGESWIASGRAVLGDGVMVKLRYVVQGEPYEIDVPFVIDAGSQD